MNLVLLPKIKKGFYRISYTPCEIDKYLDNQKLEFTVAERTAFMCDGVGIHKTQFLHEKTLVIYRESHTRERVLSLINKQYINQFSGN